VGFRTFRYSPEIYCHPGKRAHCSMDRCSKLQRLGCLLYQPKTNNTRTRSHILHIVTHYSHANQRTYQHARDAGCRASFSILGGGVAGKESSIARRQPGCSPWPGEWHNMWCFHACPAEMLPPRNGTRHRTRDAIDTYSGECLSRCALSSGCTENR